MDDEALKLLVGIQQEIAGMRVEIKELFKLQGQLRKLEERLWFLGTGVLMAMLGAILNFVLK